MIYRNSVDPIYIKKIKLRIWTIRDEIESVLKTRMIMAEAHHAATNEGSSKLGREEIDLVGLASEYNQKQQVKSAPPGLFKKSNSVQAISELKESQPVQGGEEKNNADNATVDPSAPPAGDDLEALMAQAINNPEGAEAAMNANATGDSQQIPATAPTEGTEMPPTQPLAEANNQANIDALLNKEHGPEDTDTVKNNEAKVEDQPTLSPGAYEHDNVISIVQRSPQIAKDKVGLGRLILSEILISKIMCFCDRPFVEGQSIRIEFLIPKRFIVTAKVSYCRAYSIKSKLIRQVRLRYRLVAEFTFEGPGERTLLRNFLASIATESKSKGTHAPKAAAEAKDSGDDLSDLDI